MPELNSIFTNEGCPETLLARTRRHMAELESLRCAYLSESRRKDELPDAIRIELINVAESLESTGLALILLETTIEDVEQPVIIQIESNATGDGAEVNHG